ncbi:MULTISPECIES: hypothetical protein [unclassified Isoptericola]|uniref:hypothetical protein n=1 Tax=unclassified Isoptericola TaxID=2623355 RepID=UPI00365E81E5
MSFEEDEASEGSITQVTESSIQSTLTTTVVREYAHHDRQVRLTIIRVIRDHLRPDALVSWQGHRFDFTGALFDGGSMSLIDVGSHTVLRFDEARFVRGTFSFRGATYAGGEITFTRAWFGGGRVEFQRTRFLGGYASFNRAIFDGARVNFYESEFRGGRVAFASRFKSGQIAFRRALFAGGLVDLMGADFDGAIVNFSEARTVRPGGLVIDAHDDFMPDGLLPSPWRIRVVSLDDTDL